jgi:glutamate-5-semialdehyde dehydrogenase
MSTEEGATELISTLAKNARLAARTLSHTSYEVRQSALRQIADDLEARQSDILSANAIDMAKGNSLPIAMQDRLLLTADRIKALANSVRKVSQLPDPLNEILRERTLPNGLHLQQVSVPFGVVGMVYEARPNVTIDAGVILLMSGNAALLRGSASAAKSNEVLVSVMRKALAKTSISPEVVQLIPSTDRSTVAALLQARGEVDLVIPRGSAELIRTVVDNSTVPTIETGAGICHVYVDQKADLNKALAITINSKVQRPSVCNSAETLLIHQSVAQDFLSMVLPELTAHKVVLHGDEISCEIGRALGVAIDRATEINYGTEYNALEMNVCVVPDLLAAVAHMDKFGTKHTEAIVTEDPAAAQKFIALSDCAAVMVNASTRFTDGEEMGFGAEIGISNQKLHARGPMALEAMTTTTWIVRGDGQIR